MTIPLDQLVETWRADARTSRAVGDAMPQVRDVMYEHARTIETMADQLAAALPVEAGETETFTTDDLMAISSMLTDVAEEAEESEKAWIHALARKAGRMHVQRKYGSRASSPRGEHR